MAASLVHELSPHVEPATVCEQLAGLPYRIFFDSSSQPGKYARYSFVAADPLVVIRAKDQSCTVSRKRGLSYENEAPREGTAVDHLRRLLSEFSFIRTPDLPPFQGGAAGFIGYEFGRQLERMPEPSGDELQLPDLCLGIYDCVFAWDHAAGKAWIVSHPEREHSPQHAGRHDFFRGLLERKLPEIPRPVAQTSGLPVTIESSLSREQHRAAIARIREYIAAGDIFQANLAQRFTAPLSTHPWDLYRKLRIANPAPFACFFESGELTIASASPERFLAINASGEAETRPIKGTAQRKADPRADEAARRTLLTSEKDNAEHVMIVDVLRNDLSRVCKPASVQVRELAVLETHPTVHHLVSTITGELQDGSDSMDLLTAAFPGGSITGAPKIRAMEIISELEPVRRDAYCGCMLYLSPDGVMDSSIIIRTFIATRGHLFFSAGGGIVADSDPKSEYEEILHKAAALFSVLES